MIRDTDIGQVLYPDNPHVIRAVIRRHNLTCADLWDDGGRLGFMLTVEQAQSIAERCQDLKRRKIALESLAQVSRSTPQRRSVFLAGHVIEIRQSKQGAVWVGLANLCLALGLPLTNVVKTMSSSYSPYNLSSPKGIGPALTLQQTRKWLKTVKVSSLKSSLRDRLAAGLETAVTEAMRDVPIQTAEDPNKVALAQLHQLSQQVAAISQQLAAVLGTLTTPLLMRAVDPRSEFETRLQEIDQQVFRGTIGPEQGMLARRKLVGEMRAKHRNVSFDIPLVGFKFITHVGKVYAYPTPKKHGGVSHLRASDVKNALVRAKLWENERDGALYEHGRWVIGHIGSGPNDRWTWIPSEQALAIISPELERIRLSKAEPEVDGDEIERLLRASLPL